MYIGCFRANNNTTISPDYHDNNKQRLIQDIRAMAEGNRVAGGDCNWVVYLVKSGRQIERVAAGGMDRNGKRYRLQ